MGKRDAEEPIECNSFGDVKIQIWLHENKHSISFKIILVHNEGTEDEDEQITDGFCKWDGCYNFTSEGSQHYCNIEDYIKAWQWIEDQRMSLVENAI